MYLLLELSSGAAVAAANSLRVVSRLCLSCLWPEGPGILQDRGVLLMCAYLSLSFAELYLVLSHQPLLGASMLADMWKLLG